VELSGDTVILAASQFGVGSGKAYIFERNTTDDPCPETSTPDPWCQQDILTASAGFMGDAYGFNVEVAGDIAVVGANNDDDLGDRAGAVYLYVRTPGGWSEEIKLYASDGEAGDWFGSGLAISGDTALIAASPLFGFGNPIFGSAYVFAIDFDDDGYRDSLDNCPVDSNASQSDIDLDGAGDVCDICPADATDTCDPAGQAAEEIDSSTGGTVETQDGELALDIAPDSLEGDTTVTVVDAQPTDPDVDLTIGTNAAAGTSLAAYDLGPDGTTFDPPADVTFKVDVTSLNQNQRDNLDVYKLNEDTGKFEPLGAVCVISIGPPDIADCTVSLSSFSVYAIVAPEDFDGDGVPDNFDGQFDACPLTLPSAQVDADGCSEIDRRIDPPCGCDDPWEKHGAYVSCVADVSQPLVDASLITGAEKGYITSAAARSSCGKK
jgi:hypothetical protein